MTISGTLEVPFVRDKAIPLSPLERIVGFQFSQDIYDHLQLQDQIMLDLMIEGWEQKDIADLFNVHKSWITIRLQRIRPYLASTELKRILELKQAMREGIHMEIEK